MKCTILDYGTGNLQSVQNAIEHLGHSVIRTGTFDDHHPANVLIFPGQGSFGPAMYKLEKMNLIDPLKNYVSSKRPFIGICLGFQLLFEDSEESDSRQGLSCFQGVFEKFSTPNLSVPHMGWNSIDTKNSNSILDNFDNEQFYFVHSYYLPETKETNTATTTYGTPFISAIANETQLITQFHPEKSGDVGLALLDTYFKSLS